MIDDWLGSIYAGVYADFHHPLIWLYWDSYKFFYSIFFPISPFRLSDMYREVAFSIGKQTSEEEKNTVMAAQKDLMVLKKITENYLYGDSMSSEGKAYPKSQFL